MQIHTCSCINKSRPQPFAGVRVERLIAVIEATKAALVGLAGVGILSLIHQDVHAVAARWIEHLHLNAAKKYPHIFLTAASNIGDPQLVMLASLAFIYAALRGAEAYGLWLERRWAEWLAAISGGIYIPFEIYELSQGMSLLKWTALIINVAVVAYLALKLRNEVRQPAWSKGKASTALIETAS